ncbi:MAG: hypothetical protein V4671_19590 [Armatimonadota bacterium]
MTLPKESRDRQWKEALQPLRPDSTPSPALAERITRLAVETDSARDARLRQQKSSIFPLRLAAAATISAAIIAGAATFGPKVALANTLRAVASNLRQAQGVHYRLTFFRRGKPALSQEIWQRQNQWRNEGIINGVRSVQIKADGKFWNYDPARKVAWYQKDTSTSLFPSANVEEQFRARTIQALGSGNGEDLGMVTYQGRRLQRVAVPSRVQKLPFLTPVPGRTVLTIDRDRMLPALTEQQVREGNAWVTVSQVELDLHDSVSTDVFTIQDKNVRIYDINAYGAQAGSRFRQPLASKKFATRTIAVRDVQVNREGDLFILYTDGSTPKQNRLVFPGDIRDDRGTKYTGTAGGIDPYMYHENPQNSRGMTVDGQVIQGFCLVPLVPVTPLPTSALPQKVTITFGFTERQGKKTFSGRTRFTVPVQRTNTLLPGYAADLAILDLSGGAQQFKQTREDGRRVYYLNSRDWSGVIGSTDRSIAQGIADVNTYLDRADAFLEIGKQEEARTALSAARAADENGFYADRITQAEARLAKPR